MQEILYNNAQNNQMCNVMQVQVGVVVLLIFGTYIDWTWFWLFMNNKLGVRFVWGVLNEKYDSYNTCLLSYLSLYILHLISFIATVVVCTSIQMKTNLKVVCLSKNYYLNCILCSFYKSVWMRYCSWFPPDFYKSESMDLYQISITLCCPPGPHFGFLFDYLLYAYDIKI